MYRDAFMSQADFGMIGTEIQDGHLCLGMGGLQVLQQY
jgi:hypothetical protein